jgi:hypothetical protein
MKNFHRWVVVVRSGDFLTLQIGVHRFPQSKGSHASNTRHCLQLPAQWISARKGYVLMLPLVQLPDRSRELASMIFCPLDINRRASSARIHLVA